MRRVQIEVATKARQSVARRTPPCSLKMDEHDWVYVAFDGLVLTVCCADCGRTPLEIMGEWPLIRSG